MTNYLHIDYNNHRDSEIIPLNEEFQLAPFSKKTTHGKFIPDKEPCLYCNDDFYWHNYIFPNKYCPNCGRKVD